LVLNRSQLKSRASTRLFYADYSPISPISPIGGLALWRFVIRE
tara:strand:+ start:518 stop:646 length:129 start_codon:yes stop_codon:yes gene_type:complete